MKGSLVFQLTNKNRSKGLSGNSHQGGWWFVIVISCNLQWLIQHYYKLVRLSITGISTLQFYSEGSWSKFYETFKHFGDQIKCFRPNLSCHDIQHNDIQRNDTQHNDGQHNENQHNDIKHMSLLSVMDLIVKFSINDTQLNNTRHKHGMNYNLLCQLSLC